MSDEICHDSVWSNLGFLISNFGFLDDNYHGHVLAISLAFSIVGTYLPITRVLLSEPRIASIGGMFPRPLNLLG